MMDQLMLLKSSEKSITLSPNTRVRDRVNRKNAKNTQKKIRENRDFTRFYLVLHHSHVFLGYTGWEKVTEDQLRVLLVHY